MSAMEPALEERREPRTDGGIVDRPLGEMRGTPLGAGHLHAGVAAGGPAAHHRVGHLGVELDRVGSGAVAHRLHPEDVALGEQAMRDRKSTRLNSSHTVISY